jgi:hypothetical protein
MLCRKADSRQLTRSEVVRAITDCRKEMEDVLEVTAQRA